MDSNLQKLIKEAHQKCSNIDKAVIYIRRKLDCHKQRDVWVEELINLGIRVKIGWFRHGIRTILKQNRTKRGPEVIAATSHVWLESILDEWPFRNKKLGDATKDELLVEIVSERNEERGHAFNAAFYEALVRKLGEGDMRVREKFNESTTRKLLKKITAEEGLVRSA